VLEKYRSNYEELMRCLGPCEPPLIAYYSDTVPQNHLGPHGGFDIRMDTVRDIAKALLHLPKIIKNKDATFRCMFQYIMETRKTGIPSVFNYENFGCPGFRFYSGYTEKLPSFNHYFVTTGIPGLFPGERFMPRPQSSKNSAAKLEGRTPKGKNLVFARLDSPDQLDKTARQAAGIEAVIFFANPEIITGLAGLVRFAADDDDAVRSIYCSGCASLFAWPVQLQLLGKEQAVLGVFDPAARPWLKNGEMTLAMSLDLFKKILASYKDSFMYKHIKSRSKPGGDFIFGWKDVLRRSREFDKRME
jgi:hypothetical protein